MHSPVVFWVVARTAGLKDMLMCSSDYFHTCFDEEAMCVHEVHGSPMAMECLVVVDRQGG